MATRRLLLVAMLVAMVTKSSSDVTTPSTTNPPRDGATSKRSEATAKFLELQSLRSEKNNRKLDSTTIGGSSDGSNEGTKDLDVNSLSTADVEQVGRIVDALESLGVLEQSRGICYSLSRISRRDSSTPNSMTVEVSFVVNSFSAKDVQDGKGDPDTKPATFSGGKTAQMSSKDQQLNDCLRKKPAILPLDNSTAMENDTSSITYDSSPDTGNLTTIIVSGGRSSPSGNQGQEVVADHPKGLSRTQITVITTCSLVIGIFFTVAVILRVRNHIKRKKESEEIARRPTFRSCSVSLRSQNENSTSRNALKEDEAEMIDKEDEEGAESPRKSPVNHTNRYLPLVNSCSAPSTPRFHGNAQYEQCFQERNDMQENPTTPDNETYVAMDPQRYTIEASRSTSFGQSKPSPAPADEVGDTEGGLPPPLPKKGVGRLTANLGISGKCYERMLENGRAPEIPPRLPIKGPPRLVPLRKAPDPPPRAGFPTHNPPPSGHGTPRPSRLDMNLKNQNAESPRRKKRPEVILQPSAHQSSFCKPASSPSNSSIASGLGGLPFLGKRNQYHQLENHLTTPECDCNAVSPHSCALSPLSSAVSPHSSVLSPGETVSTEVETPLTIDSSPLDGGGGGTIVVLPQHIVSPNFPVSFQNPAYSIVTSPENGVSANGGMVQDGSASGLMKHFKNYLHHSVDGLDDTSPCSPVMSPCSEASKSRSNCTLDDQQSVSFYDARSMDSFQSVRSNNLSSTTGSNTASPLRSQKTASSDKDARRQFRDLYEDHMREANGLDEDSSEETPMTSLLSSTNQGEPPLKKKQAKDTPPVATGTNCNESSFLLGPEFEGMEPTYV